MRGTAPFSDQDVGEEASDEAVEDDGFRERESQPLDAGELSPKLGLTGDGLYHRAEDVADADAGAERPETDAEREGDRLAGVGAVFGGSEEEERKHLGGSSL